MTAKAFIIAELVASITWHLYCLTICQQPVDNLWTQGLFMLITSLLSYWLIYLQDKKVHLEELDKFIEQRDVTVAVFTTLSIFVLSNIGFILSGTRQFQTRPAFSSSGQPSISLVFCSYSPKNLNNTIAIYGRS